MVSVFGVLAVAVIFFQYFPLLSSLCITVASWKKLKRRFLFFVFLSLMGLGLSSLLNNITNLVNTLAIGTIDHKLMPKTIILGPIFAILVLVLQFKLVKHWRVYEANSI